VSFGRRCEQLVCFEKVTGMAEGTIKKLTDKGFGFIDTGNGGDMFFHMSNLDGVQFEQLREGQRVTFTPGQGPKGPRAENVRPA
jgi:CspA family cold shock protein